MSLTRTLLCTLYSLASSPSVLCTLLHLPPTLQAELEATRKRMNRGREKIRQRCLAEEKAQREAEQAAQRAAEEEVELCRLTSRGKMCIYTCIAH